MYIKKINHVLQRIKNIDYETGKLHMFRRTAYSQNSKLAVFNYILQL